MEKLKRGQRPIDWKENCEKFYEYYHKRNPDWTIEQCKEAAKKFNRSINWQCIEFYQKKYPDKTLEECEEMRKQAIAEKNENHSFNIEYYRKRFPNASEEELKQMLIDAKKSIWKRDQIIQVRIIQHTIPKHHLSKEDKDPQNI